MFLTRFRDFFFIFHLSWHDIDLGVFNSVLQLERFIGGIGKGLWTDGAEGTRKKKRKENTTSILAILWQYYGILSSFFPFFDVHHFH